MERGVEAVALEESPREGPARDEEMVLDEDEASGARAWELEERDASNLVFFERVGDAETPCDLRFPRVLGVSGSSTSIPAGDERTAGRSSWASGNWSVSSSSSSPP
jgi:hypothetical protein